jgi:reverse transcriptase-like protein
MVMRTLHAAAAGRAVRGRAVCVVSLRWDSEEHGRVVRRRPRHAHGSATHRATLLALWEARRLGARAVVVRTDDAALVAQFAGQEEVPPSELACYLQIRALANAFESAHIEYADATSDADMYAVTSALAAGAPRHYADLPLWVAAAS